MREHHGADLREDLRLIGGHGVYDPDSGQFLTGSCMDDAMPRAEWVRSINVGDRALPAELNALDAKGAGGAGCGGSLRALSNAAVNGIGAMGIHHRDSPLTPNKGWHAIQNAVQRQ